MRNFTRARRWFVIASTIAVAASAFSGPAAAVEVTTPGECPAILPVARLPLDRVGRGWTVARGTTPQPFRVKYLGVLDDAVGAGRDLIIVEVSDVNGSDIITRANGIWAGISGSPVYLDGALVGAVSYSLNAGPAYLAGVTPAEDMAEILALGGAAPTAVARANRIRVPDALRSRLAERGYALQAATAEFERLPVPLAVSGLTSSRRARLQNDMDAAGSPVVVTTGTRAALPAGGVATARPVAGGNFAALLTYGDVTMGGVGSTTYVCGDRALAFGHPLLHSGRATHGANDAHALAIVPGVVRAYKLANVTGPFGTVDQDRVAGLGARLGATPATIPITSRVTALDNGTTRAGRTDVTAAAFLPIAAAYHLFANYDATHDAQAPGSVLMRYTLRGHLASGETFEVKRANRYVDENDVTLPPAQDIYQSLSTIRDNPFAGVVFDSVRIESSISDTYAPYAIETVLISRNGGAFRERTSLTLRVGDQLVIRTFLRRYGGASTSVDMPMTVRVPGDGSLIVGRPEFWYPTTPSGSGFHALLESIRDAPRNDDVTAELLLYGMNGYQAAGAAKTRVDSVVRGYVDIPATVRP